MADPRVSEHFDSTDGRSVFSCAHAGCSYSRGAPANDRYANAAHRLSGPSLTQTRLVSGALSGVCLSAAI